MLNLHKEYLIENYDSEGKIQSYSLRVPDQFNFAYDVIDRIAAIEPQRRAMFWCHEDGEEHTFSFLDMKEKSDACASFFQQQGIKRGDKVMLILKRHYQFWFAILALHKIGAVAIPATNQLQVKDLVYRFNAAEVSAIVCTADGDISELVDQAAVEYPHNLTKILVKGERDGWLSFEKGLAGAPAFARPVGADVPGNEDMMLLYFTSGTTGMPKMVTHDFYYAIGHIPTAKYWHKVDPDGLHLTVSETGWAKSV